MRQLAYDYGQHGIRSTRWPPRHHHRRSHEKTSGATKPRRSRAHHEGHTPRRLSEPREIAAAVVFLASDEAAT
jgi:NAD(P)-dependent dehydrogenase (short-subunit alcohol dehydrogenase family)